MHSAMIKAGSEYPGFGPFVRMTDRLNEEHTTWRGDVMKREMHCIMNTQNLLKNTKHQWVALFL